MATSSSNAENHVFRIHSIPSNEHLVFAETLRDWRDPLLQGHNPVPVLLCSRCALCKCHSLKDIHNTSSTNLNHQHKHEPSCPHARHQHVRSKTPNQRPTTSTQIKRRSTSHDSSRSVLNTSSSSSSIIQSKSIENSSPSCLNKRKTSSSKIPVRISTSILNKSPKPSTNMNKSRSASGPTKIPRLISNQKSQSSPRETSELYENDSLDDDDGGGDDRTSQLISDNEDSVVLKKQDSLVTNEQLNQMDDQSSIKRKRRKHKHNHSISDKRHNEGRHSKSQSTSHDLLSSSSLSSSSPSIVPLKKKSHSSHRQSSTPQILSISSDESEQPSSQHSISNSAVVSADQSNHLSISSSSSSSSSIYLIQVTKPANETNPFGLAKTTPYVWENIDIPNGENSLYPYYSIELIPPLNNYENCSVPVIASRDIVLQRSQVDSWQNLEQSPESIITSSCQNYTGSASHLVSSSIGAEQQAEVPVNSSGNIISITTTKRYRPSLFNKTECTVWNIGSTGKKSRQYTKAKWHSDNQLDKHSPARKKHHTQCPVDNHRDTGSSSEQDNQSAPIILQHIDKINLINDSDQVLETVSLNVNSKQIDSIVHDNLSLHRISSMSNDKPSESPVISCQMIVSKPQTSYASTDEDVDEINSNYFEDIDRSMTTIDDYRERLNIRLHTSESNDNQTNSMCCSRMLSIEHSQITVDSGVDIASEQKQFQPNAALTVDEQMTDQNDLFNLSDDSLMGSETDMKTFLFNHSAVEHSEQITEQESFFSAKSELNNEKSIYYSYELETITDEEDDCNIKDESSEFIFTTENLPPADPGLPAIPPQYELKLPSFGEWIDRAFRAFLSDTLHNQTDSQLSSRSSSMVSLHTPHSTVNTSSSSQIITVLDNENFPHEANDENADSQHVQLLSKNADEHDDDHSLNDMSSSSLSSEKVDFDVYIINSNYEKINPSIAYGQNEIPFLNERSKSLLSSITSSMERDGQEVMNNKGMQNYGDEKSVEIDDDDFPQPIVLPTHRDDLSLSLIYEKFQYSSNSHDSLNQSDHHIDTATSSIDDLTKTHQPLSSTFHSKDSALGLSYDNLNCSQTNPSIGSNEDNKQQNASPFEICQEAVVDKNEIEINWIADTNTESMQKDDMMVLSTGNHIQSNEHEKSAERTISTSSSEQLIPKEKQTGMYYKAFGSSAAIQLAEQYNGSWLSDKPVSTTSNENPIETDNNHVRIVHLSQTIGDDEDEFYFSPQTIHSCNSCPNFASKSTGLVVRDRSYSLTTLDAYAHLNVTHEALEHIWQSLLNVAFSDKDDNELNEYKLRHIFGLSNSYSNINNGLIEKSHSHNDIFTIMKRNSPKPIMKIKSKSFDITPLLRQSSPMIHSGNLGLLQGADISEPFADRIISLSMQSDLESIPSIEQEPIFNESSVPSPVPKEPLNYVFNFGSQLDNEEYELTPITENESHPIQISVTFEDNNDDDIEMLPILHIPDIYTELSLFRPHSLSTIPSSRGSQYASSIDSDEIFERERHSSKEAYAESFDDNYHCHISDDDRGVIGSEFSSPQSRPLSSIHSQPLSPEQNQEHKSVSFSNIDHDAWERCIDEPIFYDDLSLNYKTEDEIISLNQYCHRLTAIVPIESDNEKQNIRTDQIEPITWFNDSNPEDHDSNNFIQETDEHNHFDIIGQDYITMEQQTNNGLDPNELANRLEQLHTSDDISIDKQDLTQNIFCLDDQEEGLIRNIENLTSIVTDIHQTINLKTPPTIKPILVQTEIIESKQPTTITKLTTNLPVRYPRQSIDKVSDLEIVKQGKGFKIGYTDRQGTDQRVILTKHIETAPDIIQRDLHTRLPYKQKRLLNKMLSSVLYTNGNTTIKEDRAFERSAENIEVSAIGTNPKHFDESDMVSIDIDGPSTMLNSICESIIITQGSVYTAPPSKPRPENTQTQTTSNNTSHVISNQYEEYLIQTFHPLKADKIEIFDSWHDHTIINGSSAAWRGSFKPIKYRTPSLNAIHSNGTLSSHSTEQENRFDSGKQEKHTRDISLSPITVYCEKQYTTTCTSPITVSHTTDKSCQYSPPIKEDRGLQCSFETKTIYTQVSSFDIPYYLHTPNGTQTNGHLNSRTTSLNPATLERSADSGILVDDNRRTKSNFASQVDMKSSSSDSDDMSEVAARSILQPKPPPNNMPPEKPTVAISNEKASVSDVEREILQLRRERAHVLDLLSLNWNRSNIWVELTEAKLNYIIGETDALLRSLSYDSTSVDNELVKLKMHQYENDMAELTRQHLTVYRERLEDSKKQLDIKIGELELKKSSIDHTLTNPITATFEHTPRSVHNNKRLNSFLSTSADNLTLTPIQDAIASHPHLLDVSFLTSTPLKTNNYQTHFSNHHDENGENVQTLYQTTTAATAHDPALSTNQECGCFKPLTNQNNGNLSNMEGLSKSQQAILDETDKLVKDSQQLHSESASQFERARESLLSSETPIRLARANMAASRLSPYLDKKTYSSNNATLAELFKYEQLLAKEAAKSTNRHLYTN